MKIVSACLAGINCKYNGGSSANQKVMKLVKEGKAIPLCPEQLAGFPTPREKREKKDSRVITESGEDVTALMEKGARETLAVAKIFDVREAILKARSPSCGKDEVYDGSFSGKIVHGDGITASMLMRNGVKVLTEEEI